jgi:hypothetical protein
VCICGNLLEEDGSPSWVWIIHVRTPKCTGSGEYAVSGRMACLKTRAILGRNLLRKHLQNDPGMNAAGARSEDQRSNSNDSILE